MKIDPYNPAIYAAIIDVFVLGGIFGMWFDNAAEPKQAQSEKERQFIYSLNSSDTHCWNDSGGRKCYQPHHIVISTSNDKIQSFTVEDAEKIAVRSVSAKNRYDNIGQYIDNRGRSASE